MSDTLKAKRVLADATMRRGLMAYLWGCKMDAEKKANKIPQPMPPYGDEQIKEELKRILLGK